MFTGLRVGEIFENRRVRFARAVNAKHTLDGV
jgi:hypothetical protein